MLRRRSALSLALSLGLASALVACGGSSDTVPSATLNVTPALGIVYNGDVSVFSSTGTLLGTGSTGSTGTAAVQLFGSVSGPMVIRLALTTNSEYFNEAANGGQGAVVKVPAATSLLSVLPSLPANKSAGVTKLTNVAAKVAGLDAANLNVASANLTSAKVTDAVVQTIARLGLPAINILAAPVPATVSNPLPSDDYSKFIALISKNVPVGSTPLTVAGELASAFTTGGVASGGAVKIQNFSTTILQPAADDVTNLTVSPPIVSEVINPSIISEISEAISGAISSGGATGATGGTTGALGGLSASN